jgi:mono/diheme cytochrome c family protein
MQSDWSSKVIPGMCALAVAIALCTPAKADDKSAALFKEKCAACHGPDGSGNTPTGKALSVPDLRSDEVQKQTDAQVIDATANGKGKKMPAYKGKLTDDQIKQLVGYIRELAKKK